MSSPTWQDRRFMWQSGKEKHEPTRRLSSSSGKDIADAAQKAASTESPFNITKPNSAENPFIKKADTAPVAAMASAAPLKDRHVIWQKGKEVHEPVRKMSQGGGASMPTAERRRSSASSTSSQGASFGNLLGVRTGFEKGAYLPNLGRPSQKGEIERTASGFRN